MRQRLAGVQHPLAVATLHRRTIRIVQRPFHQVAGREEVFEALLVLDADAVAAKFVGNPQGGDVHLALQEDLLVGEVVLVPRSGLEFHSLLLHPPSDRSGLGIAGFHRLVVEGGLAEPFLKEAGGVQEVVGDDGVEHPHAAFVEDAHDRLVGLQLLRQGRPQPLFGRRYLDAPQRRDVRSGMFHFAILEPAVQFAEEL